MSARRGGNALSSSSILTEDPYRLSTLPSGLILRQPKPTSARRQPLSAGPPDMVRSRSTPRDLSSPVLPSIEALRTLIRNRYARRGNLMQVFSEWDRGRLGYIRPEDVMYMLGAMGIHVSLEEACLLVATANKSRTGRLNLEEFLEMIKCEVTPAHSLPTQDLTSVRASLEDRAAQLHTDSMHAFLVQKLRSRLHQITQAMLRKDKAGSGFISLKDFLAVVDVLKLPSETVNETHWERVYATYRGQAAEGLNIRAFAEALRQSESPSKPTNPVLRQYPQQLTPSPDSSDRDEFLVLDGRSVPVNKLEAIQTRARRIKRLLRDRFKSEDSLHRALFASGGKDITVANLKGFLCDEAAIDPAESIGKEDIEAFLSAVQYSAYGRADIKSIARSVFIEEYRDDSLTRRTRPLPPARPALPGARPMTLSRREELLTELGVKLYAQRCAQAFQAFRFFDRDGDGYVSREDFNGGLQRLNIAFESSESDQLLDYLDQDRNGFLSYHEFASGLRLNPGRRELPSVLAAAKDMYQRHSQELKSSPRKMESMPEPGLYYGHRPEGHVTRDIFQSPSTHSIDEKSRFQRKNLSPISYTREDRERRQRQVEGRMNAIKEYRNRESSTIVEMERAADEMANKRLWQKAVAVENYEKVRTRQRCRIFPA